VTAEPQARVVLGETEDFMPRRARFRIGWVGFSVLVGLAACDDAPIGVCNTDLRMRLSPREATLHVGQSLTPDARFFTCSGQQQVDTPTAFASDAPEIVNVSVDGRTLHAVAPGATRVRLNGGEWGSVGDIQVTVEPAP
jgi:hypothetical protein